MSTHLYAGEADKLMPAALFAVLAGLNLLVWQGASGNRAYQSGTTTV